MEISKALEELRKQKRKFMQSVDLIVNLQNFDVRKESINTFIQIPNPSPKKICGFLTRKSDACDVVLKDDFEKFKTDKEIKKFAKRYDFFIAAAGLMGAVATKFGRVLGPMGKMPSPQAGILAVDDDKSIKAMVEKMKKLIRIRTKENSIKLAIGKEDMSDEEIKQNYEAVMHTLENALPKGKQNIKNILIKLTMTKPIKILDNTITKAKAKLIEKNKSGWENESD